MSAPLTAGVSSISYITNSTFTYPANALLLAQDAGGNPLAVVMSPATGYHGGGRVLVIGDHNAFTDSNIGGGDNMQFATNFANWACYIGPSAVEPTTWGTLKSRYVD